MYFFKKLHGYSDEDLVNLVRLVSLGPETNIHVTFPKINIFQSYCRFEQLTMRAVVCTMKSGVSSGTIRQKSALCTTNVVPVEWTTRKVFYHVYIYINIYTYIYIYMGEKKMSSGPTGEICLG